MFQGSNPGGSKRFFYSLEMSRVTLGSTHLTYSVGTRGFFWGEGGLSGQLVKLTIHLYTVLGLRMSGAILPLLYAFMVCTGTTLPLQFICWCCRRPLLFKLSVQCLVHISHFCHVYLHGIGWGAIGNYSHDRYQSAAC
jgi:hypothetical protein